MARLEQEELLKRIEEGKVKIIEALNNKRLKWTENAAIWFVNPANGGKDNYSTTQVCHAGLNGRYRDCTKGQAVVNVLMDGSGYATGRILPKEVELWFVDYILNRSPYQSTFIEKDAEKALETQVTVSTGEVPANLMSAGMVALRRLWEYTSVAHTAYDLVQAGVNEDLAYVLGHLITCGEGVTPDSSVDWKNCRAGHCSLNPAVMGFKELKNFLAHNVVTPRANYFDGGEYDGYDPMYGKANGTDIHGYVVRNFPYERYTDVAKVETNPFTRALAAPQADVVKYPLAIKVMAEWANEHLMEKINNA